MHIFGDSWAARITLVSALACVYAGAVQINNNLLFGWTEFDRFRYLVFLPSGLKLVLLMLFGWRAVIGVGVGAATVALFTVRRHRLAGRSRHRPVFWPSPWLALRGVSRWIKIDYPWNDLTFGAIALISIWVGLVDALGHHVALSFAGADVLVDLIKDLIPATFGRVFGTFLFLWVAVGVRSEIARKDSSAP